MSRYEEMVRENLQHMGTIATDWRAVPVSDMQETTDDRGNPVKMPVFNFPEGYTAAPTLYPKQTGFDGVTNCELCNHAIKRAYWVQCDSRKWLLLVGSECVTHFAGGTNGEQAARQSVAEATRQLVADLEAAQSAIFRDFGGAITRNHWGEPVINLRYSNTEQGKLWQAIADVRQHAKGTVTAKKCWNGEPVFTDRQLANWAKKNADDARRLLSEARALLDSKTAAAG